METTNTTNDTQSIGKIIRLLYYSIGIVNALLALRFLFKAFGASEASPIVQLTYAITDVLILPFRGIFETAAAGESVIEPSIIVAIIIYSLLAQAVVEFIRIMANRKKD